ncbi:MAG: helicase associated domain-containing protein, partial [Psychrosphaera sp.]|nr:helicase associated domain-containing protein [Psychrosphaera sp.]
MYNAQKPDLDVKLSQKTKTKREIKSFENILDLLRDYQQQHGDCKVPVEYETAKGYRLGTWVSTRKREYKNNRLLPTKIEQLNAIGFVWKTHEEAWQTGLDALVDYKQQHGDCLVYTYHKTSKGYYLGSWVHRCRQEYSNNILRQTKVDQLNALDFVWCVDSDKWQLGLDALIDYKQQYSDCLVHQGYKTQNGFALGSLVIGQRKKYHIRNFKPERMDR